MRLVIDIAVAILVAVLIGFSTAWLAVNQGFLFGAIHAGGWTAWPTAGSADADPYSLLWPLADDTRDLITPKVLAEAVGRDDPTAKAVWTAAIELLGVAVANVITLLAPACVVIGGGVSLVGEALLGPLRDEVAKQVFQPFADSYRIVAAGLGESVVLHGALKLARDAEQ